MMGFASVYIARNIQQKVFITTTPPKELGMSVIIPVCDEAELIRTIESLASCYPPALKAEVLLVINESEDASAAVRLQNEATVSEIAHWKENHPDCFFAVHVLRPGAFPRKHAGAGLARKTGMDEAIRRFACCDNPEGILISLDADTLVARNYFSEIQQIFQSPANPVGATICFQHRIEEIQDERQREGMRLYESYLHYYKQALQFTGYPNAIYTIGSAFAVRADAYVKQGGMSKRQAGEDFYFLHKLTGLGAIAEIHSTGVYPSARLSNRVPFGTGPSLQKWVDGDESLRKAYSFRAFADLKTFFTLVPAWFDAEPVELFNLSEPIRQFLQADNFSNALAEIRGNSAGFSAFEKRFFRYFNAFKILKFLNFTHPSFYTFQDLNKAFAELKEHEVR